MKVYGIVAVLSQVRRVQFSARISPQPDGSFGFSAHCGLRTADFLGRGFGNFLCEQLLRIKPFSVSPQSLQVIVNPGLLGKNVNHQIDVVHEDPLDRKSTRLNSSHDETSRMPSSA